MTVKGSTASQRILDRVVLVALIAQIAFIMVMNLVRADTIIDFDSSSAYMHEMEMANQGTIFPSEYSYQASLDLDSAAVISAFLYHFTGNIFLSRGIANNLVVLLYIYIVTTVLANLSLSKTWKRFGILLFLIPYSMNILGYWRTLFAGGGFFAFRALVPLLLISLILDIDKGRPIKEYAFRAFLTLFLVFLTGLSSGAYIMFCAVFPLLLWEAVRAFLKADFRALKSKRTLLGMAGLLAAGLGIIAQKTVGFSSTADSKLILTSKKWIDALLSSFAGLFELFGGLTTHEGVRLFSLEAAGTAVNAGVTILLITVIIYSFRTCIEKRSISNMKGYIFSLMLVNVLMFAFLDLKYGDTVFESRYHLIPMLPAFFLLSGTLEELPDNGRLRKPQANCLQILIVGLFLTSLLYGDAQWLYAKTALGSEKLSELNQIIEGEGVNTAFVVGEDSKDLGRKIRVYSGDTHYIVVNDGAESAFRTTWGGTTRYLDNSMQAGRTAIIASPEAYATLPEYLISDMKYLRDYDGLDIYIADESRFDCVGGPVAEKDRVVDFPYSPGYSYENALLDRDGTLAIKEGGGRLIGEYASAPGSWDYTVYYDMPDTGEGGLIEIKVGDKEPVRMELKAADNVARVDGVVMQEGERVRFDMKAPQGSRIKRIEITRRK
ncbi:MAG: hypothetical protein K5989_08105 [Lachnospiraceae bacterium]|nr:hypothetical protein [Lachnospiraceae bacterium]